MSVLVGKIAYKPVGMLLDAGAGMVSGLVFKQITHIDHTEEHKS